MAKKKTESVLVQAAERVGRSLGRGVRRLDTVKAAAKKLVSGTGRKKTAKKAAKKRAKTAVKKAASTPVSTRRSRALTTMAAMKGQLGTMVDERARARATSGERWSARKPR